MRVHAEFCIIPLGIGVSLSDYVVACQRVLEEAGLEVELHSHGTNLEGEWEEVLGAVKRCHQVVHEMGAARISTTLKLGTRIDRAQSLADKVESVRQKMEKS